MGEYSLPGGLRRRSRNACPRRGDSRGTSHGEKDQTVQRTVSRRPRSGRAGAPLREEQQDRRSRWGHRGRPGAGSGPPDGQGQRRAGKGAGETGAQAMIPGDAK